MEDEKHETLLIWIINRPANDGSSFHTHSATRMTIQSDDPRTLCGVRVWVCVCAEYACALCAPSMGIPLIFYAM